MRTTVNKAKHIVFQSDMIKKVHTMIKSAKLARAELLVNHKSCKEVDEFLKQLKHTHKSLQRGFEAIVNPRYKITEKSRKHKRSPTEAGVIISNPRDITPYLALNKILFNNQ